MWKVDDARIQLAVLRWAGFECRSPTEGKPSFCEMFSSEASDFLFYRKAKVAQICKDGRVKAIVDLGSWIAEGHGQILTRILLFTRSAAF